MRMKLFGDISGDKIYDAVSIFCIFIFALIGVIFGVTKAQFQGESDSYILATVAFENHGSLDIRTEDISVLESENYPFDVVERARSRFDTKAYLVSKQGGIYPFYTGAYSISVIPMRIVNRIFNFPQIYAHQISNVIFYSLALFAVFFFSRQKTRRNVFFTILLLICSPTFVYITWASAEVFICSLMIMSLVFLTNNNRFAGAFFLSVASTLNLVICGFGLIIIADHFFSIYKNEKTLLCDAQNTRITDIIKRQWKKTVGLAACYIPTVFTVIWNIYRFGAITPLIGDNLNNHLDVFWLRRFIAYIFDLNFGFLPYFPILLVLFFCIVILGIIKKNRMTIMISLGFFVTVLLYAIMMHINCGMNAMSRYNAWSVPFIIITVVSQYNILFRNTKLHLAITVLFFLSAGTTIFITGIVMNYNSGSYLQFTPVARFVLDNAPILYNPYPYTFINRTMGIDGGYDYTATTPFVYKNNDGFVTKILIPPMCVDPVKCFSLNFTSDGSSMSWLNEQVKRNNTFKWTYINVNSNKQIKYAQSYVLGNTILLTSETDSSRYFLSGLSFAEANHTWSEGFESVFTAKLNGQVSADLTLDILFIIFPGVDGFQTIRLFSSEHLIDERVIYPADSFQNASFIIPRETLPVDGTVELRFEYPNACSPRELYGSSDDRILAVGFREITISENN